MDRPLSVSSDSLLPGLFGFGLVPAWVGSLPLELGFLLWIQVPALVTTGADPPQVIPPRPTQGPELPVTKALDHLENVDPLTDSTVDLVAPHHAEKLRRHLHFAFLERGPKPGRVIWTGSNGPRCFSLQSGQNQPPAGSLLWRLAGPSLQPIAWACTRARFAWWWGGWTLTSP